MGDSGTPRLVPSGGKRTYQESKSRPRATKLKSYSSVPGQKQGSIGGLSNSQPTGGKPNFAGHHAFNGSGANSGRPDIGNARSFPINQNGSGGLLNSMTPYTDATSAARRNRVFYKLRLLDHVDGSHSAYGRGTLLFALKNSQVGENSPAIACWSLQQMNDRMAKYGDAVYASLVRQDGHLQDEIDDYGDLVLQQSGFGQIREVTTPTEIRIASVDEFVANFNFVGSIIRSTHDNGPNDRLYTMNAWGPRETPNQFAKRIHSGVCCYLLITPTPYSAGQQVRAIQEHYEGIDDDDESSDDEGNYGKMSARGYGNGYFDVTGDFDGTRPKINAATHHMPPKPRGLKTQVQIVPVSGLGRRPSHQSCVKPSKNYPFAKPGPTDMDGHVITKFQFSKVVEFDADNRTPFAKMDVDLDEVPSAIQQQQLVATGQDRTRPVKYSGVYKFPQGLHTIGTAIRVATVMHPGNEPPSIAQLSNSTNSIRNFNSLILGPTKSMVAHMNGMTETFL